MDGLQRVLRVAPQLLIHVHKVVYVEVRVSRQCRLVEDLKGGWQLKGCHAYLSLHPYFQRQLGQRKRARASGADLGSPRVFKKCHRILYEAGEDSGKAVVQRAVVGQLLEPAAGPAHAILAKVHV